MSAIIEVTNLIKRYEFQSEQVFALNDVSLKVMEGEFIAILGTSGSGKSTLMNMIAGFDTPTSGQIYINGKDLSKFNDNKKSDYRNKTIGFIFQAFNLDNSLTAIENVMLPLVYAKVPKKKRVTLALMALEMVHLGNRKYHKPSQLSGGQKQRVSIARAVVNNPKIILADEPTGNLDTISGENVMNILNNLNEKGYTIIMVTHNKQQADKAKRIIELSDGKIVRDVSTQGK